MEQLTAFQVIRTRELVTVRPDQKLVEYADTIELWQRYKHNDPKFPDFWNRTGVWKQEDITPFYGRTNV